MVAEGLPYHPLRGRLASFAIRARAPLFCDQPLTLVGGPTANGASAWAVTPAGTIGMSAEATFV